MHAAFCFLLPVYYLPPNITQSPRGEVAMKRSIGSDNQALVREAINAWRASSGGAAGPAPVSAAMMRLLFGQMIPQTFSNIIRPMAPPTPIDKALLLA